jgi:hypothetical protein
VGLLYVPDDIMVHEIRNERIAFHIALLKGGRPDEGMKRVAPATVLPAVPSLIVHSFKRLHLTSLHANILCGFQSLATGK